MTAGALPVIRVIERGASVYVSLPWGYPSVHAAFLSWLGGRRREYKPALHAYRLARERRPDLEAWLSTHAHGCEVRWVKQDG